MGPGIIYDAEREEAALANTSTGFAFGPIFTPTREHDARELADIYIDMTSRPRRMWDSELEINYLELRNLCEQDPCGCPRCTKEREDEAEDEARADAWDAEWERKHGGTQ